MVLATAYIITSNGLHGSFNTNGSFYQTLHMPRHFSDASSKTIFDHNFGSPSNWKLHLLANYHHNLIWGQLQTVNNTFDQTLSKVWCSLAMHVSRTLKVHNHLPLFPAALNTYQLFPSLLHCETESAHTTCCKSQQNLSHLPCEQNSKTISLSPVLAALDTYQLFPFPCCCTVKVLAHRMFLMVTGVQMYKCI